MTRAGEVRTAWMLLTRLPAGHARSHAPLPAAVWAFPLVGALVGVLMWAVFAFALWLGLPPLAAALLALVASALATGGLHEDGLADTADGFGGGASRDRKLAIMRDSRIGSYGVLALVLTLGLTATGMAEGGTLARFVAIGAASRTAMLLPMAFLRPARAEGLGRSATIGADARVGVALGLTLILALGAPAVLVPMLAMALAMTALMRAQIGGQTGDTLGATQKITEATGWLAAAALA